MAGPLLLEHKVLMPPLEERCRQHSHLLTEPAEVQSSCKQLPRPWPMVGSLEWHTVVHTCHGTLHVNTCRGTILPQAVPQPLIMTWPYHRHTRCSCLQQSRFQQLWSTSCVPTVCKLDKFYMGLATAQTAAMPSCLVFSGTLGQKSPKEEATTYAVMLFSHTALLQHK